MQPNLIWCCVLKITVSVQVHVPRHHLLHMRCRKDQVCMRERHHLSPLDAFKQPFGAHEVKMAELDYTAGSHKIWIVADTAICGRCLWILDNHAAMLTDETLKVMAT